MTLLLPGDLLLVWLATAGPPLASAICCLLCGEISCDTSTLRAGPYKPGLAVENPPTQTLKIGDQVAADPSRGLVGTLRRGDRDAAKV